MGVLFVAVCGLGTANSLFLAAYLLHTSKGERALNRALAALTLTFSARVAKAVALLFVGHLHPLFEFLWIVALGLTGVAALVYVHRVIGRPPLRRPAVVGALVVFLVLGGLAVAALPVGTTWRLTVTALLVYAASLGTALYAIRLRWSDTSPRLRRWLGLVMAFCGSIWALYVTMVIAAMVAPPIDEDQFFRVEAVLFSVAVYALVYAELRVGLVGRLHQPAEPERARVDPDDPLLERLRLAVEQDCLFLDPSLSLPSLAQRVHLSPQHVSRLINSGVGSSFNDYLNRLRVQEACRILAGPDGPGRKVGALAFECGFGSASVFYAAFRKFTGVTPAEYQKTASLPADARATTPIGPGSTPK